MSWRPRPAKLSELLRHLCNFKSFWSLNLLKMWHIVYFEVICFIAYRLGLAGPKRQLGKRRKDWVNHLIKYDGVCRAAFGFARFCWILFWLWRLAFPLSEHLVYICWGNCKCVNYKCANLKDVKVWYIWESNICSTF